MLIVVMNLKYLIPNVCFEHIPQKIKGYLVKALNCKESQLTIDEITVRTAVDLGQGMSNTIEIDIFAQPVAETMTNRDQICRDFENYFLEEIMNVDVKARIIFAEMGSNKK